MKAVECKNCGAQNAEYKKCRSCGAKPEKPKAQTLDTESWESKVKRFSQTGLVEGPRKVPLALTLIAFRPSLLILSGALGLIHLSLLIGFALIFWFGFRRFQLLRSGFLVRPEIVSVEKGWGSLETNSSRDGKGWHAESFGYQGPNYKNKLRLWGPNGKSKIIKTSGLEAKLSKGYFLVLPNTPRVNVSVCSWFQTSLNPKTDSGKFGQKHTGV